MTLIELIEEYEEFFVIIKKRFFYLEKILGELDKITENKLFNIRGDVVYQMLIDSYHMLVIDMASLALRMIRKKGFFRKLPNFVSDLKRPDAKVVGASYFKTYSINDKFAERAILDNALKCFKKLFPVCFTEGRDKPSLKDISSLKDEFYTVCEEVINDRNRNRAHKYEKAETNKPSVKILTILDLEKKFKKIESLMNDLRMVCSLSSYESNDVNFSNSERMAESLVDLILIGDYNTVNVAFGISKDLHDSNGKYPYEYRELYYEELHSKHELQIQRVHEMATKKFREEHGDYSKIKVPTVPLNFKIFND